MQSDPHNDETLEPAGQQGTPGERSPGRPVSGDGAGTPAQPAQPSPPGTPPPPGAPPIPGPPTFPGAQGPPVPPPMMPPQDRPTDREPMADLRFDASADAQPTGDAVRGGGEPATEPAAAAASGTPGPSRLETGGVTPSSTISAQPRSSDITTEGVVPSGDAAPPSEWLDQVCPYLLSEDGTWRSTQPDPGHRCMAQDPPGELPSMFQERFCLSDRHVRCEWFKVAQSARPADAGAQAVAREPAEGSRLMASVRSLPLSLAGSGAADDGGAASGARRPPRSLLIALALIGGFLILVLIAVLFSGDGGGDGAGAGSSPGSTADAILVPTSAPTARPTERPVAAATDGPATTDAPANTSEPAGQDILVVYEVQPGERLEAIADQFGIRRRRIIRANEGMADATPQVQEGQEIIVPAPASMARDEITALDGFVRFAEPSEG